MTVPAGDGIFGKISDDTYQSDKGSLSSTGARLLLPPSCPAKFKHVTDNPPPPKPEYTFGHVAHRLVLGEGMEIVEIEAPDFRTKDAQDARKKAIADGKAPILTNELLKAKQMAAKVMEHPVASRIFADGSPEMSLWTTDEETGVRCRARPDWLAAGWERPWIADYKTSTTSRVEDFERKAADFGYHQQAAWYLDVVKAVGIFERDPAFVFVVQEKEPPFLVSVLEYDADAIEEGRRLNRQAIEVYARCVESGVWPGYPGEGVVQPMMLPAWAYRQATINDLLEWEITGE